MLSEDILLLCWLCTLKFFFQPLGCHLIGLWNFFHGEKISCNFISLLVPRCPPLLDGAALSTPAMSVPTFSMVPRCQVSRFQSPRRRLRILFRLVSLRMQRKCSANAPVILQQSSRSTGSTPNISGRPGSADTANLLFICCCNIWIVKTEFAVDLRDLRRVTCDLRTSMCWRTRLNLSTSVADCVRPTQHWRTINVATDVVFITSTLIAILRQTPSERHYSRTTSLRTGYLLIEAKLMQLVNASQSLSIMAIFQRPTPSAVGLLPPTYIG